MKKFSPIVIMNTFIRSITVLVGLVFFVGCNETLKPKEEMISEKVISSEAKSIDYNSEKDNFKLECFTMYYKGKLFTGKLEKYGPGDYLKKEANYNNGIPNNISEYYDNGKVKTKSSFIALNDTTIGQNGLYKKYYKSGNIKAQGEFKNGNQIGLFEEYYKNGQIKEKAIFEEGKQNFQITEYDQNGQIIFNGRKKRNNRIGIEVCNRNPESHYGKIRDM